MFFTGSAGAAVIMAAPAAASRDEAGGEAPTMARLRLPVCVLRKPFRLDPWLVEGSPVENEREAVTPAENGFHRFELRSGLRARLRSCLPQNRRERAAATGLAEHPAPIPAAGEPDTLDLPAQLRAAEGLRRELQRRHLGTTRFQLIPSTDAERR